VHKVACEEVLDPPTGGLLLSFFTSLELHAIMSNGYVYTIWARCSSISWLTSEEVPFKKKKTSEEVEL
jgi:hypothetical protein